MKLAESYFPRLYKKIMILAIISKGLRNVPRIFKRYLGQMPSLGVSCRSMFTGTGALCGEKQLHFGGRHFHKKSAGQ